MLINNLLPALAGVTQPVTRPVKPGAGGGAAGDVTDENAGAAGKVRFVIEAPVPQPQTYEQPISVGADAAQGADSFGVLLNEQQALVAANSNTSNVAPFQNATAAYAAAEDVAQFARPQGFYIGAI